MWVMFTGNKLQLRKRELHVKKQKLITMTRDHWLAKSKYKYLTTVITKDYRYTKDITGNDSNEYTLRGKQFQLYFFWMISGRSI